MLRIASTSSQSEELWGSVDVGLDGVLIQHWDGVTSDAT
ncbi:hypothetical protein PSEEN1780 [Pseudomonas entomophila L48]|uniref:Uncharacterized protein n=1 Tax=Pseudomonas entomophila (strain L48) TaxID=384676 RepID=Q1ICJ0_PSEE4|nr:hypothetical protein PSEEN1780 [Pseudomonas entomophila L48]